MGRLGLRTPSYPRVGRPGHRPGTGGLQGNAGIKWLPMPSLAPSQQQSFCRAGVRHAWPTGDTQSWGQHFPHGHTAPAFAAISCLSPERPQPPWHRGRAGSAGGGGTRAARARAHTWPKAMAGTAGRLSCQRSRVTPQPGNGAAWSAVRGRAPPGTAGDTPCTAPRVAGVLLGQEGAEPAVSPSVPAHTTGSRRRPARHRTLSPRNRRPVLRLSGDHWVAPERRGAIAPCPSPGARRKPPKTRPSRCSSLVRLRLERSDDSGVLRAPSATQSSTWTPFLALNSVFIDSSAHCLG